MLDKIVALIHDPLVWAAALVCLLLLIGYYAFAAWVGSLDVPEDKHSAEYRRWKYLNILAANLKRAAKAGHIPVAETTMLSADDVEEIKSKSQGAGQ